MSLLLPAEPARHSPQMPWFRQCREYPQDDTSPPDTGGSPSRSSSGKGVTRQARSARPLPATLDLPRRTLSPPGVDSWCPPSVGPATRFTSITWQCFPRLSSWPPPTQGRGGFSSLPGRPTVRLSPRQAPFGFLFSVTLFTLNLPSGGTPTAIHATFARMKMPGWSRLRPCSVDLRQSAPEARPYAFGVSRAKQSRQRRGTPLQLHTAG